MRGIDKQRVGENGISIETQILPFREVVALWISFAILHPQLINDSLKVAVVLPFVEYFRQIFWASAMDLPDELDHVIENLTLDTLELPAHEKAQLSLQLPAEFLIIFEPVTHAAQFIDVKGEPTRERQNLSIVFTGLKAPTTTVEMRPGPLRLSPRAATSHRPGG